MLEKYKYLGFKRAFNHLPNLDNRIAKFAHLIKNVLKIKQLCCELYSGKCRVKSWNGILSRKMENLEQWSGLISESFEQCVEISVALFVSCTCKTLWELPSVTQTNTQH